MIRLTLLTVFVFALAAYAWRDWYRSLCGLILLMAVVEHPDMPKNMMGVQGLNPWNILLVVILLAWLAQRSSEGQRWDLPKGTGFLLFAYVAVLAVSTFRLFLDPGGLENTTTSNMVGEYVINTFKWIIPGLLLFLGCRSRERFVWGVTAVLGLYLLLGLQVIKWMPPSSVMSGGDLSARSLKILSNEVGYSRVNLSMLLAGASWAVLAMRPLFKRWVWPVMLFLLLTYAQALTGGRAGYVTWAAVGLILCVVRWRKYLLLAPVAALLVSLLAPAAVQRMSQGFTADSRDGNPLVRAEQATRNVSPDEPDSYTITAGRTFAWPFVIDEIKHSPVVGYGREAMVRTGLAAFLWRHYLESFPHPHNAYLEVLLDNGLVGFVIVVPFYLLVLRQSLSLFRGKESDIEAVAGGVTAALVLALLCASMGSQTFYPREGSVGMWCAIGLMWRIAKDRRGVLGPRNSAGEEVTMPLSVQSPGFGF